MKSRLSIVFLAFLLALSFVVIASAAPKKEFKKDLDEVLDKVNDVLFSTESSIKFVDYKELCRKMITTIKKFEEKYPDDSSVSHNLKIIVSVTKFEIEEVQSSVDSPLDIDACTSILARSTELIEKVLKACKEGIKSGVKVDLSALIDEFNKKYGLKIRSEKYR